jgi:hypothetical protein
MLAKALAAAYSRGCVGPIALAAAGTTTTGFPQDAAISLHHGKKVRLVNEGLQRLVSKPACCKKAAIS